MRRHIHPSLFPTVSGETYSDWLRRVHCYYPKYREIHSTIIPNIVQYVAFFYDNYGDEILVYSQMSHELSLTN